MRQLYASAAPLHVPSIKLPAVKKQEPEKPVSVVNKEEVKAKPGIVFEKSNATNNVAPTSVMKDAAHSNNKAVHEVVKSKEEKKVLVPADRKKNIKLTVRDKE